MSRDSFVGNGKDEKKILRLDVVDVVLDNKRILAPNALRVAAGDSTTTVVRPDLVFRQVLQTCINKSRTASPKEA